jgi:hypothetical protein
MNTFYLLFDSLAKLTNAINEIAITVKNMTTHPHQSFKKKNQSIKQPIENDET